MLLIAVLAVLAAPGHNDLFAGLPLDRWPELVLLLALAPLVFSSSLRAEAHRALARRGRLGLTVVLVLVCAAKLALLAGAPPRGFEACYSTPLAAAPGGECELSYANPFRLSGVTRFDPRLDFPHRAENPAAAGLPWRVLLRDGPLTVSRWNLDFFNDERFNFNPGDAGAPDRDRPPLALRTRGEVELDAGEPVRVTYVGEGELRLGGRTLELPPAYGAPATAGLDLAAGRSDLDLRFLFERAEVPAEAPYATLRLEQGGERLEPAPPAAGWRLLSLAADAGLAAVGVLLVAWLAFLLRGYLPGAAGLAVLGALAWRVEAPRELLGIGPFPPTFAYLLPLAALLAALAWRPGRRPLLAAWAGAVAVAAVKTAEEVQYSDAVLYPNAGDDPLAFEALARQVFTTGSPEGGEDVYFFQPGYRYLLAAGRMLLGPAALPLSLVGLAGLAFGVLFLARRLGLLGDGGAVGGRVRMAGLTACGLLLALLLLDTQVGNLRVSNAEWVTWILLPLGAGLLFGARGRGDELWGCALLGLAAFVRMNQWPLVAVVVAAWAIGVPRERRRELLAPLALVAAFALLPLAHNLAYGGALEPALSPSPIQGVQPSELPEFFSDEGVRERVLDQLARALYLPPLLESGARPDLRRPDDKVVFLALALLWLAAAGAAVLWWRSLRPSALLLLASPLAAISVFAVFEVAIYYPRHAVAGFLAMGIAVAYAASPRARRTATSELAAG